MHRLFVGLRPPPAIRAGLMATMEGVAGARWQDDEQLHVTLRFIGEVEPPVAEDVAVALQGIVFESPAIALYGVGSFDDRGRVKALWAGVRPHAPLARLHRKIDAALVRIGLAPEGRAYLPHVTLARLSVPDEVARPWLAQHAGLASPDFVADAFLLYESHLGRGGAHYEAIARYPLG